MKREEKNVISLEKQTEKIADLQEKLADKQGDLADLQAEVTVACAPATNPSGGGNNGGVSTAA